MRVFYFFMILFMSMFTLIGVAILMQPTPLRDTLTPHEQAIAWVTLDKEIHESFLEKPENPEYAYPYINTGNHKFHQKWIDRFTEVLKYMNNQPSKYNKQECIDILKEAQASHAGVVSCEYDVLLWNYEWFERYDKIIAHIEGVIR